MVEVTPFRSLDLFSGIGGFALGFKNAGVETIAFAECNPYAKSVLGLRFKGVPIFNDVKDITNSVITSLGRIDIISAGFPCQDISIAGTGTGLSGPRSGLWWEAHRIIAQAKPRYAVLENSPALRSRGLEEVIGSLASVGYDAEWHCIPAGAVGARHRRDRIWIIAHLADTGSAGLPLSQRDPVLTEGRWKEGRATTERGWWAVEPALDRMVNGVPKRVDRLKCLGNSVVPVIPEIIARAILEHSAA